MLLLKDIEDPYMILGCKRSKTYRPAQCCCDTESPSPEGCRVAKCHRGRRQSACANPGKTSKGPAGYSTVPDFWEVNFARHLPLKEMANQLFDYVLVQRRHKTYSHHRHSTHFLHANTHIKKVQINAKNAKEVHLIVKRWHPFVPATKWHWCKWSSSGCSWAWRTCSRSPECLHCSHTWPNWSWWYSITLYLDNQPHAPKHC